MSKQRKRHTPEQIVRKLDQADRLVGEGKTVTDVCRELEVADQTYYRWRNQYDGMKAHDAKRLKELKQLQLCGHYNHQQATLWFRTASPRPVGARLSAEPVTSTVVTGSMGCAFGVCQ